MKSRELRVGRGPQARVDFLHAQTRTLHSAHEKTCSVDGRTRRRCRPSMHPKQAHKAVPQVVCLGGCLNDEKRASILTPPHSAGTSFLVCTSTFAHGTLLSRHSLPARALASPLAKAGFIVYNIHLMLPSALEYCTPGPEYLVGLGFRAVLRGRPLCLDGLIG